MSRGLAHVGVTVADLERAVRFYTEVYLRDPDGYTIELFQAPP